MVWEAASGDESGDGGDLSVERKRQAETFILSVAKLYYRCFIYQAVPICTPTDKPSRSTLHSSELFGTAPKEGHEH